MGKVLDFNLAACQVTIGSFRVTGWGESDAAEIAPQSDLAESTVAGDGAHTTVARKNDNRHDLTLTLSWGSVGSKLIHDKMEEQLEESREGAVSPLAIQIYDPVTGTKVVERAGRFMRRPDITLGTEPGELEYKVLLPDPVITYGANIG